jgi:hypothetical protein
MARVLNRLQWQNPITVTTPIPIPLEKLLGSTATTNDRRNLDSRVLTEAEQKTLKVLANSGRRGDRVRAARILKAFRHRQDPHCHQCGCELETASGTTLYADGIVCEPCIRAIQSAGRLARKASRQALQGVRR